MNWHQRIGGMLRLLWHILPVIRRGVPVLPVLIAALTASAAPGDAVAQPAARGCNNCAPARTPPPPPDLSTPEAAFTAARNAATANNATRFEEAAARIGSAHALSPYLEYWRLRMRFSDTGIEAIVVDDRAAAFLASHAGTLVADLLRRDWLLALGRQQQWDRFDRVLGEATVGDDTAIGCFALQSRAARGDAVAADARPLLLAPRDLGDACNSLLAALALDGQLSQTDLWRRLEAALESGSPGAVRRAALLVNPGLDARQLARALSRPAPLLADARLPRELALVAIATLARSDPGAAAGRLQDPALRLPAGDRAFLWSQVAAAGTRRLAPESLEWARRASAARPSDDTLAWMVRAALREQDWPAVRATIERMSPASRADPAWVYWLGRATAADPKPESQHQARVLFTSITHRANFYSQLAGEELGVLTTVPQRATPPTEAELAEVRGMPGFVRALAFYELGLRLEGNREWNFQLRGLTDRQLLAAAEHARQRGFLDRAIGSADRTRDEHDYWLRFVTPFSDRLTPVAKSMGLDIAWVYGLIRQESRFSLEARSSAGASGLMQLMPATARWVAGKAGIRDFRPAQVNNLDTNLQLGTYYLRMVLDELDGSPLLASAAYNAGPGRPRAWRGALARPVEGAIFAEIIPFPETRGYVKAVLSNAAYYSAMITGRPQSLRALLGTVHPAPPNGANHGAVLPATE